MTAFSHFNPVSQTLKLKKQQSQLLHGLDLDEPCRQLTFDQFVRLPFEQDIPQFIEDFFMHMTTLSLRELVKRGPHSPSMSKLVRKRESSTKTMIALMDSHDNNLTQRGLQYVKVSAMYEAETVRKVTESFKCLAVNKDSNKMKLFLT